MMSLCAQTGVSKTIEDVGRKLYPSCNFGDVLCHLSSIITLFNQRYQKCPREAILRMESFLSMKKWTEFSKMNREIVPYFSSLNHSDVNSIFLGKGLCVGVTIQYLSQFFATGLLLESASLPIVQEPISFSTVKFYPIDSKAADLKEKTKVLRFLQAAYTIASSFKPGDSFEYIPKRLLSEKNLELVNRFPSNKTSYPIDDLLLTLKNLEDGGKKKKGYLIGLAGLENHSLELHLQAPYHFFDQQYGLAISEDKEEFLLFLANYLTEKYSGYPSFALLEFQAKDRETSPQTPQEKNLVLQA